MATAVYSNRDQILNGRLKDGTIVSDEDRFAYEGFYRKGIEISIDRKISQKALDVIKHIGMMGLIIGGIIVTATVSPWIGIPMIAIGSMYYGIKIAKVSHYKKINKAKKYKKLLLELNERKPRSCQSLLSSSDNKDAWYEHDLFNTQQPERKRDQ